jgi:hypothetical protein
MVACELLSHSIQLHLSQVYAGFVMLHRSGRVRVRQRIVRERAPRPGPQHLREAPDYQLRVMLGSLALNYDVHDSWEVDEERLASVDLYFKRSFAPERLSSLGPELRAKVRPLGLNYAVYPDGTDRFGLARSLGLGRGARRVVEAARALGLPNAFVFTSRVGAMSAPPDAERNPRVLFMVRAFDPHDDRDRAREKSEERRAINDARAQCIRTLRSELGDRFYGGFVHTPYAVRNYAQWLAPEASRGAKGRYIELLRSFPICVATTGIHGSIGWKFAEYVAFSKAIVSERLHYQATGDLAPGHNYLEFAGVDECVASVVRLLEDRELRASLMANNAAYYQRYLRPDALVWNTLEVALGIRPA